MDISKARDAFAALAQDTRLSVFRLLITAAPDGLPAGDIARRLDVVQNTLSAHLTVLERAGLIGHVREGRSLRYRLRHDRLGALLSYLLEDCCGAGPAASRAVIEDICRDCC